MSLYLDISIFVLLFRRCLKRPSRRSLVRGATTATGKRCINSYARIFARPTGSRIDTVDTGIRLAIWSEKRTAD